MTHPRRAANTELFALRDPPPMRVEIGGHGYCLTRVFKHDFYAATCLYELVEPSRPDFPAALAMPKVVVKFGRIRPFCGVPTEWLGRWMRSHEQSIYKVLEGIPGIPAWAGCLGPAGYAIEYIDGLPLDHFPHPPAGFFDRLRELLDRVHERGVGYGDSNKRSNILIGPRDQPFLIDYQLAVRRRDDLPWPLRPIIAAVVRAIVRRDLYHLYKHKRRLSPDELTPEEDAISRRRGGLLGIHRRLTKPYRAARRWFLQRQFRKGALTSPTEDLEDHDQPEKATWRTPGPTE